MNHHRLRLHILSLWTAIALQMSTSVSALPATGPSGSDEAPTPIDVGPFDASELAPGPQLAQGAINVTGSTRTARAAFGQNAPLQATWRVDLIGGVTLPAVIRSSGGTFYDGTGAQPLGSFSRALTRGVANFGPVSLPERVTVPASVIYRARKLGSTSIRFERSFSAQGRAGGPTVVAQALISVPIASAAGGPLAVSRLELRYEGDEILKVVKRGEALQAYAYLNYAGGGLIDARWEVATPPSTRGTPSFFNLRVVRQYLGAGREAVLQSPPLPTDLIGTHLVRLSIVNPDVGFEPAVLRYVVNAPEGGATTPAGAVELLAPATDAALSASTQFRWTPVTGAAAYRIEFYDAPEESAPVSLERVAEPLDRWATDKPMAAGQMLPAGSENATVSAASLAHLQAGHRYRWRVVGISADGKPLASSGWRTIRMTATAPPP